MLQIISGKFFKSNDLNISPCFGIAYSNFSWIKEIETSVATLNPVTTYLPISSYAITYEYRIEKSSKIIKIGETDIINQFQNLCSFGLKAFFNSDRNYVSFLCRKSAEDHSEKYLPSEYVSRFFEPKIMGTLDEIQYIEAFINQVIGLPRDTYNKITFCIANFLNALEILSVNFDLAYSMMVYTLESLSQNFDGYEPKWDDYNQEIKAKLEKCFKDLSDENSNKIKEILLSDIHLKNQKRFIDFIDQNLNDDYYISASKGVINALKKSHLKEAMTNAYQLRSKYSHQLRSVLDQLTYPGINKHDVFQWENKSYLTLQGLTRLTHYVISNFIWSQSTIGKEDINWQTQISGIGQLRMSPEYWIYKVDNLHEDDAKLKLTGFLDLFTDILQKKRDSIPELSILLEKYEQMIPVAKKENKLALFVLYFLYNNFIILDKILPGVNAFIGKNNGLLSECTIESLLAFLLTCQTWPWSINECISKFEQFSRSQFKNSIVIPTLMYVSLIIRIANMFLENQNFDAYNEWLDKAIVNCPGWIEIQKYILECKIKKIEIDISKILTNNV